MEKWILITGSSKGLGKALALVFAENKFNIILHGRNNNELKDVEKKILEKNVKCVVVQGDLNELKTLESLEKISKEKKISVLINNAAFRMEKEELSKISDGAIDEMILTNLIAPIKLTKRIYSIFLDNGGGTIVDINSISGRENQELRTLYCASKWGLRGFTDTFRLEAEKNNVKVIEVYPSRIKTRPENEYGMEAVDVAKDIFEAYNNKNVRDLILDDRPEEFKKKKKKVLICGATGFIGRNIAERLVQRPDLEVYGTYFELVPWKDERIRMVRADLREKVDVERVVEGMDIIIQAAATTSGAKDIVTRPYIHVTDNALMNSLIFRAAHDFNVKHVVFFSCSVMYQSQEKPVREEDFDANKELYKNYFGVGWTKVYIEKMCEFYSRIGDTKYTVIRHSNIYGPWDKFDLEKSHVFGATMTKVMTAKDKITVWGTGEEERDLLYVSDLVDFVELSLDQKEIFELVNVGLGKSVSVKDLVKKIINASGKNIEIEHDTSKPTIKTSLCLDYAKAKNIFGWEPKTTLEEGIEKTMKWYKENILDER